MPGKRTIITISQEDKQWLDRYSRVHQISFAQAVRYGIQELREKENTKTYQTTLKKTKGLWKRKDGLSFQRKVRAEWK